MNQDKKRVAVIGGGISGLAAAYQLIADGAPAEITVFETTDRLGGVLQTEEADGFRLELGPDSMLSRVPWGVDLCRQIGLAEDLISTNPSPQGVHVVCRGRLQRVPEGLAIMAPQRVWPFVTTPILSWAGKLRLAAEALIPRRNTDADETLADFSRRRLGRETFQRLVQPMAGGIYMGDPEQLSIQATFPQFVEMESQYGSLVRAARAGQAKARQAKTQQPPSKGGPQYRLFVAPRRGAAQLIETLATQLSGCQIHCRHQVERLVPDDAGGWIAEVVDRASGERRHESYDGAILALPAHQASRLLGEAHQELSGELGGIPYAGCVVVNLAFQREAIAHPLDSFGFVVPHVERRSVLACTFSSVKYAERAPEGKALVRAFLGGACYPEVLEWSDQQVLEVVQKELEDLIGLRNSPVSRITRWHEAMPQYVLGHPARVQRIEGLVAQLPGLEVTGNGYHGVGIPHCIHGGQQASQRLMATLSENQSR